MDKYFLKPLRLNTDENLSFFYFRSFITYYYCIIFSKNNSENVKKYFELVYGDNKYFNLFKNEFLTNQNPLIFTYFNNIPFAFYPYPEELYYYYPIITFYGNSRFYQKGPIKMKGKLNGSFQRTPKLDKNEIQITIPINLLSKYKIPNNYYFLAKIGNKIIATKNISIIGNELIIHNYKIKTNKYRDVKEKLSIKLDDIEYCSFLQPLTQEKFLRCFKIDEIKKDSWLYYVSRWEDESKQNFFTFFPKINMFDVDVKLDFDWKCTRNKLVKNLKVLNLVVDIFYNNEIVNKKVDLKFLDYKKENYEEEIEDYLFRCLNYDKEMDKRKDICNYNIMEAMGSQTFVKNKGKKMINLLIFKNHHFLNYKEIYYSDFLEKYGIIAFVYHYGYLLKNNTRKYYDMELGFTNSKYRNEYVKKVDSQKGDCPILYKKGKL